MLAFVLLEPCAPKGACTVPRGLGAGNRAWLPYTILNKARRGEQLEMRLPIGFVYDTEARVRLDPDARIQESIRQFFRTFRRTGSAMATVKAFRDQGLQFPRRIYRGAQKGDVLWAELEHTRALWLLHHPRYAGAFCFGRLRTRKHPDGHLVHEQLPREEWIAFIRDAHEGYVTWEEFEQNLQLLHEIAKCLDVSPETIKIWRRAGLLLAHRYNDTGQCLFVPPGADAPTKFRHQGKTPRTTPTIKANTPTTHV